MANPYEAPLETQSVQETTESPRNLIYIGCGCAAVGLMLLFLMTIFWYAAMEKPQQATPTVPMPAPVAPVPTPAAPPQVAPQN